MKFTQKITVVFLLVLLLALFSCAPVAIKTQLTYGPEDAKWVRKTLEKMTLEEKIGQMVVLSYTGKFFNRESDFVTNLESLVREKKIGGLILFGGEVYETAHLTNRLQNLAKIPLLIASDFERGAGNQVTGATLFPPLMAIGAADSDGLAYEMGRITALEGRAMGIHMTYAPVVDVNINPENPIISTRAIGETPEHVSRLTVAFIKGCQENGLIATAKHFPGHGDTDLDSHTLLPVINASRERLEKIELYPFKKAIEGGVEAIMTAHLHIPALDPTPGIPATLSPLIMTGLLRKEMGFKGIIVTDAMNMGGVTNSFSPGDAALKAVEAGVDLILLPADTYAAINTLIKAVSAGQIAQSRINESVRRILEAKARIGLHKSRLVDIEALPVKVASKSFLSQAAKTFESSVTLVKNSGDILPVSVSGKKIAVLSLSSDLGDYYAGRTLVQEIEKRTRGYVALYADGNSGTEHLEEAKSKALECDVIICALFSSLRAGKGSIGLSEKHVQLVKYLAESSVPVVAISFGSPYFLTQFPDVEAYLCAYRNIPAAQEAVAKAILGEIDVRGKLPVTIPGLFSLGHGIMLSKKSNP